MRRSGRAFVLCHERVEDDGLRPGQLRQVAVERDSVGAEPRVRRLDAGLVLGDGLLARGNAGLEACEQARPGTQLADPLRDGVLPRVEMGRALVWRGGSRVVGGSAHGE